MIPSAFRTFDRLLLTLNGKLSRLQGAARAGISARWSAPRVPLLVDALRGLLRCSGCPSVGITDSFELAATAVTM